MAVGSGWKIAVRKRVSRWVAAVRGPVSRRLATVRERASQWVDTTRRSVRSATLPTRIIVLVFAAALVTGIAVTLVATGSTESFLRSKIDERFPQLLTAASRSLDHWYEQRELDMSTFASSDTVIKSLMAEGDTRQIRDEARRYLAYVQDGFPHYRALFVLDSAGKTRVSVGEEPALPDALRASLAAVDATRVSPALGGQGPRFQVISAPIQRGKRRIGTLHAVIRLEAVENLLAPDGLDARTGLYVFDPGANVVARTPDAPERSAFERRLPKAGERPSVSNYTTPGGDHVMGSAVRFERFDWTLVVEQDYEEAFAPVVSAIQRVLAMNIGIVLGFGAIALIIARSIVRPIHALSEGARRIAQGDTDVEIPRAPGQDEIGVLSRALHEMVERLRQNQIELQRKQEEIAQANEGLTRVNAELQRNNEMLEQLSFTDGLTCLHNHRYFQDRLRVEVRRCDRTHEPLALLLVDIDDFKLLNDRYGHAVGDEVLLRVATLLNGGVRETDLPARYGGEEFAVIAPRTDSAGAVALAEKLRHGVSSARFTHLEVDDPKGISVTVSIGVALYGGDPKRFFNEADRALYQAKGQGKDCVVLFDPKSETA